MQRCFQILEIEVEKYDGVQVTLSHLSPGKTGKNSVLFKRGNLFINGNFKGHVLCFERMFILIDFLHGYSLTRSEGIILLSLLKNTALLMLT